MYKKLFGSLWGSEEIGYEADLIYWRNLDDNIKESVIAIANFFVNADQIVAKVIEEKIISHFESQSTGHLKTIFDLIEVMENIHIESYSEYVNVVIRSTHPNEAESILIGTYQNTELLLNWCREKYDLHKDNIVLLLVIHSIVEGIFFTGPFAFINWIKDRLPNLKQQNLFISRDEGGHTTVDQLAITYFMQSDSSLNNYLEPIIVDLYKEGATLACDVIVKDVLKIDFTLMTREMMVRHIKYVANQQLSQLNIRPIFPVTSTDFHDMVSYNISNTITDFFETNPKDYDRTIINDGLGAF